MALTAKVKDELLRATGGGLEARAAEAAALIRFGGEIQPAEGGVAIVADFEEEAVARRLASTVADLCAVEASVELLAPSSGNRESRYEVRVDDGAAEVIRRLKLVTASGHPVGRVFHATERTPACSKDRCKTLSTNSPACPASARSPRSASRSTC